MNHSRLHPSTVMEKHLHYIIYTGTVRYSPPVSNRFTTTRPHFNSKYELKDRPSAGHRQLSGLRDQWKYWRFSERAFVYASSLCLCLKSRNEVMKTEEEEGLLLQVQISLFYIKENLRMVQVSVRNIVRVRVTLCQWYWVLLFSVCIEKIPRTRILSVHPTIKQNMTINEK